jgi:hypothetical protein
MNTDPQFQHRWLQQFVGEWRCASEPVTDATQEGGRWSGRETVRALGDLWVLFEGRGDMPDGTAAHTLMTLGFDPSCDEGGRFVGNWVGSMMTTLWRYDGELDAAGRVLSLYSEGPDFSGSGRARYRDTIEVFGPDERTLSSHMQDAAGNWHPIMLIRFRRQPSRD